MPPIRAELFRKDGAVFRGGGLGGAHIQSLRQVFPRLEPSRFSAQPALPGLQERRRALREVARSRVCRGLRACSPPSAVGAAASPVQADLARAAADPGRLRGPRPRGPGDARRVVPCARRYCGNDRAAAASSPIDEPARSTFARRRSTAATEPVGAADCDGPADEGRRSAVATCEPVRGRVHLRGRVVRLLRARVLLAPRRDPVAPLLKELGGRGRERRAQLRERLKCHAAFAGLELLPVPPMQSGLVRRSLDRDLPRVPDPPEVRAETTTKSSLLWRGRFRHAGAASDSTQTPTTPRLGVLGSRVSRILGA